MKNYIIYFVLLFCPLLLNAKPNLNKSTYNSIELKDSTYVVGDIKYRDSGLFLTIECVDGEIFNVRKTNILNTSTVTDDYYDVVLMKDQTEISGMIVKKVPGKSLKIKNLKNELVEIELSEIKSITKVDHENFNYIDKPYSEIGISIGTPCAINLHFNRWIGRIGLGISGMKYNSLNGFEGSFKVKIKDYYNSQFSFEIIFGDASIKYSRKNIFLDKINNGYEWKYMGGAFKVNLGILHAQLGLTAGTGSVSDNMGRRPLTSPQLMFQLGLVHRFI